MRKIVFLILLTQLPALLYSQNPKVQITGTVLDSETLKPLQGANVVLFGTTIGSTTDENGNYILKNVPLGTLTISVSFIGFKTQQNEIWFNQNKSNLNFKLEPTILRGKEVIVTATRAVKGETPVAFSTLTQEDIKVRYFAQDIPVMLSELPSTTFYSESGNGVGYNYLSIRGFGQRRISVMINGIPQNDPEDHNTYWVNVPDFLGNVDDIQVQRGAGSAFYGPPAIGGSLNIITTRFQPERKVTFYSGYGSYGTQKYSLALNSGLIKNKYILFGRVSQIKSDGYRDQSWVDFKSYFLGLARFGKKSSLRLHFYGGPIEDHLAYYGISKQDALNKKNLDVRKQNPITRTDELENFNQPHLELFHNYQISDKLAVNNTVFGIKGFGYFDYDGSWAPMSYFRLTPEFGFDVSDPENFYVDDLLIRAYVDNKQLGWLPNVTWKTEKLNFVAGSEIRIHRSLHWGRIQKGSNNLPVAISGNFSGNTYIGERRYYEYNGAKNIISPFVHTNYQIRKDINIMFDLQFSHKKFRLYNEKYVGNDFDLSYNFINPRIGINHNIKDNLNVFTSFSRTSREPRLKTFYDAAEASTPASWGAVLPQFEKKSNGDFDYNKPLVKPETLNDIELGFGYQAFNFDFDVNLFYMDFKDEIIKKGQLDRFGQPITGNADRSLHTGVEVSGKINLTSSITASGNFTYSKNELKTYTVFASDGTPISLNGNPIAGFPDFLANLRLNYSNNSINAFLAMQHVGNQFTDNYRNQEYTVDASTVFNGMIGLDLQKLIGRPGFNFQVHFRNIFNSIYISHGEGDQFFPAAERQIFSNLKIEL